MLLATLAALTVAHLPAASAAPAIGVAPVMRVDPAAATPSGPVWLVTKNAMTTGPERTALIDLLTRHIERQRDGDTIRLTSWSFHSQRIADDLIAAHQRGVTVRVVVDKRTWRTGAVRSLRRALGTSAARDSYIVAPYRQSTHAKVATFSRDRTVHISSANVSDPRQWNHTVVLAHSELFAQTSAWADKLGAGQGMVYTRVRTPGVTLHFYPGTVDPVLRAIRKANGKPITVQMSIWSGSRGNTVARALIAAHRAGSPVTVNTGERWSDGVRAVAAAGIDVFDTQAATGGKAKAHDKLLIVGDDVYTGSTNWGALPRTFSEVVARISSPELADQLREYVARTREQAAGSPVPAAPQPQRFSVAPSPGGLTAAFSAAGPAIDALDSFDVLVREQAGGRVVARSNVPVARSADGRVNATAVLRASFTDLPGGVPVVVELVGMGDAGPVRDARTLTTTPYLTQPAAPTGVSATPVAPRRAAVAFVPSSAAHEPPLKGYEVAWSSNRGDTWRSTTTTSTSLVLRGLPRDVRTLVRVREVPTLGTASAFSRAAAVRPSKKPDRPQSVTIRVRRSSVAAVRWQPPAYPGRGTIQSWVVKSRVQDGPWSRTRVRPGSTTVAVLRGLPSRGELDVRVAAVNRHGRSPFAPVVSAELR